MRQIAGCEDGGCPGLWVSGDQLYAQGEPVTDPQTLAHTRPADGETLIALPTAMLSQAMATALTRLLS